MAMLAGTKQRSIDSKYPSSSSNTRKKEAFGGFSFESESLPEFSEFEGTSESEKSQGNPTKPEEGRMPPTTTIETVTISRPLKVIGFLCGLFASILLLMCLASSEWLLSKGNARPYKQGLFVYCTGKEDENIKGPPPFVPEDDLDGQTEGCHRLHLSFQAYTLVCGIFTVSALLFSIFGTLVTVFGLRCNDPNKKYKHYRLALIILAIGLIGTLVSVVVYPIGFTGIISTTETHLEWEFGWAYGVAWGATIFLFGGIILLLCDKESEEIYYKERTIVHYADAEDNKS